VDNNIFDLILTNEYLLETMPFSSGWLLDKDESPLAGSVTVATIISTIGLLTSPAAPIVWEN